MNAYVRVDPQLALEVEKAVRRPVVITVNDFDEPSLGRFSEHLVQAHATGQPVIPIIIDSYGGDPYQLLGIWP